MHSIYISNVSLEYPSTRRQSLKARNNKNLKCKITEIKILFFEYLFVDRAIRNFQDSLMQTIEVKGFIFILTVTVFV